PCSQRAPRCGEVGYSHERVAPAMTRRPILLAMLLAVLCPACGKKDQRKSVYPVRGQVFVQKQPAVDAFVIFHPLNDPDPQPTKAYGRVGKDGSFTLTTYSTGDGAPAGEYDVTISWRKLNEYGEEEGPDQLRGRYSNPKTSKLRAHVTEGTNEL